MGAVYIFAVDFHRKSSHPKINSASGARQSFRSCQNAYCTAGTPTVPRFDCTGPTAEFSRLCRTRRLAARGALLDKSDIRAQTLGATEEMAERVGRHPQTGGHDGHFSPEQRIVAIAIARAQVANARPPPSTLPPVYIRTLNPRDRSKHCRELSMLQAATASNRSSRDCTGRERRHRSRARRGSSLHPAVSGRSRARVEIETASRRAGHHVFLQHYPGPESETQPLVAAPRARQDARRRGALRLAAGAAVATAAPHVAAKMNLVAGGGEIARRRSDRATCVADATPAYWRRRGPGDRRAGRDRDRDRDRHRPVPDCGC